MLTITLEDLRKKTGLTPEQMRAVAVLNRSTGEDGYKMSGAYSVRGRDDEPYTLAFSGDNSVTLFQGDMSLGLCYLK